MRVRFKARCERIRANNGIIEALFTKRSDGRSQEEHAILNVVRGVVPFEEGKEYWIDVQPAFPH